MFWAVAWGEADVMRQKHVGALGLVGPQVGRNLPEQLERLTICNGVGEARGVLGRIGAFPGDFSCADGCEEVVEHGSFRVADANHQLTFILFVFAQEGHGAFAVYQSGDVCGIDGA
jgi:hypothetical protein